MFGNRWESLRAISIREHLSGWPRSLSSTHRESGIGSPRLNPSRSPLPTDRCRPVCHIAPFNRSGFVNRERIVFKSLVFFFLPLLPQISERGLASQALRALVRAVVPVLMNCADAAGPVRRRHEIADTESPYHPVSLPPKLLSFIPVQAPPQFGPRPQ
jgi:hypothetical protein